METTFPVHPIFTRHVAPLLNDAAFRWSLGGFVTNCIPVAALDSLPVVELDDPSFQAAYGRAQATFRKGDPTATGDPIQHLQIAISRDTNTLRLVSGAPVLLAARESGIPALWSELLYEAFDTPQLRR